MNGSIEFIQGGIIDLFNRQRQAFQGKSAEELKGIIRDCQSESANPEWTARTAAHINQAAALMALEERA